MRRSDAALLLAVPVWIWWAIDGGGYSVVSGALGLVYLTAAAAILVAAVPRPPLIGPRRIAFAALGGHAAFACASVVWADDRGLAWATATRQVLFVVAAGLVLAWPPTRAALRAGVVAFVIAAAAGAAAGVLSAFGGGEPLTDGRLTAPTGYPNATAGLLCMGALAAIGLAVSPGLRPWLRATALGISGALVGASVMSQSRGALAATVVAGIVLVALGPRRVTIGGAVASVLVVALAGAPVLLDVRNASFEGSPNTALLHASLVLVASFVALVVLARVAAAVSRETVLLVPSARIRRTAGRLPVAVGVAAVVVALVATDGVQWLENRATDVATPQYDQLEGSSSRFTGDLGSNRVDYWRVSIELLGRHPLNGTGAGGFAAAYLPERESVLSPQYAHSLWLQAAADLGLVGLLTLLVAAVALGAGFARAWRASGAEDRAMLAAAAVPAVYLGVHASVDWIALFPALVTPGLMLAAAAAGDADAQAGVGPPTRLRLDVMVLATAVAVALLAVPLALAARYQERAAEIAPSAPEQALADLARAQALNPLGSGPVSQAGIVELGRRRERVALRWFREAVQRDPDAWFPQLMRGLLEARVGDPAAGSRALNTARRLNPREPAIVRAVRAQQEGRSLEPRAIAAMLLARRS